MPFPGRRCGKAPNVAAVCGVCLHLRARTCAARRAYLLQAEEPSTGAVLKAHGEHEQRASVWRQRWHALERRASSRWVVCVKPMMGRASPLDCTHCHRIAHIILGASPAAVANAAQEPSLLPAAQKGPATKECSPPCSFRAARWSLPLGHLPLPLLRACAVAACTLWPCLLSLPSPPRA